MSILNVILPIFLVIFIGYLLKKTQFVTDSLVQSLNQLVYHILLPVLIFWEISWSPFRESFNGWLVAATSIPMGIFFCLLLLPCPTAVVAYIMASELGGDPELSSSIIMLSTLMAMVTIPLWVWFVGI